MQLMLDDLNSKKCAEIVIANPSLDQVFEQFEKLDGQSHTLLCIELKDGSNLMVGGGATSFIVTKSLPDYRNFTLKNLMCESEEIVDLCAGGQIGDFPKNIVVDKASAKAALLEFYSNKTAKYQWTKDV